MASQILTLTSYCALVLLVCCHVAITPVCTAVQPLQPLDNAKGGMDANSESHAQHRRSSHVHRTSDRRVDDILIDSESTAAGVRGDAHLWPNKTIYYTFEQTLSREDREVFQFAMDTWQSATCIQFQLAANPQDHVVFVKSGNLGCSSYVGRKGGRQEVSMNDDCFSRGTALHLVGHAIGRHHEHTRPDRDSYIDVLYENINETDRENFAKMSLDEFGHVSDVGYDIESVMHYSPNAFSKGDSGLPTIRLREDAPLEYKHCSNLLPMGQRDQLSYLDKVRTNKLYSCQAQVATLEFVGRLCVAPPSVTLNLTTSDLPSTTIKIPSTTPELPRTTVEQASKCPFSSLLPPLSPQSFVTNRLRSGNTITLQLQFTSKGMRCSPKCKPKDCQMLTPESLCHTINFQFDVIAIESQNSQRIKSGDKVALRSRCNPSKWLDCSRSNDSECTISRCGKCVGSLCYDASFVTPCTSHHFKVFGVGRRETKVLNTNYQLYFRPAFNDDNSVVSCRDDRCKLQHRQNFTNRGELLNDAQRFTATVLTEREE